MKQLRNSLKCLLFSIAFLFGGITLNSQVTVIGSTGADGPYTTIGAAFTAINAGIQTGNNITVGLTGNTTELATATLNAGTWTLLSIAPAIPVTVSGSVIGAIIKLNGADNVVIDGRISGVGNNITIANTSTAAATATVWLSSTGAGAGATNNIIRNLNLVCGVDVNSSASTSFGIISSGATITNTATLGGNDNDNNQYISNNITKCRYGIFVNGVTGNLENTTTISNNLIGPATFGVNNIGKVGIYVGFQNGVIVSGNTIQNVGVNFAMTAGGADRIGISVGSEAWGSTPGTGSILNANIARNLIHDIIEEKTFSAVGILLSAGTVASANTVCSNIVYNVRSNGTAGDDCIGIGVGGGNGDFIVHNTVSLTGDLDPVGATSLGQTPCAFRIGGVSTSNITILNNIFSVDVTSNTNMNAVCIQVPTAAFAFGTGMLNFNDYYFPAANTFMRTGGIGTTSLAATFFPTLATWQAALTPVQDANSIELDPNFVSTTDLHISLSGTNVNNVGTPVACATDFDGDARSVTTPDMGADEFTPVNCSTANGGTIAPASYTVCSGSTQALSSTGFTIGAGTTYQWVVSTVSGGPYSNVVGGTGATTPSYTTGPLVAGTYFYAMQVFCSFGSLTGISNEVTVVVNAPPPVAVLPISGSICFPGGSPITLTASGALGYSWAPPTGLSATTGASVIASPSATTTYTVIGVDAIGCTAAATTVITVSEVPSMSPVTATPPAVCSGGNSQLLTSAGTTSTYVVSPIPFASIPTPGVGVTTLANAGVAVTPLSAGDLDDGGWQNQALPFNFIFFGVSYNSFAVSTNGFAFLGTGAPNTFTGYGNAFPSAAAGRPSIGAVYSDLDFRTAGKVEYFTTGIAPYRATVINWSAGNFFSAVGSVTTQIIIYETTNVIEVHTTNSTGTNTAVEGIQNAAGTTAITVAGRNNVTWPVSVADAYRWSPSGGAVTYSWSPATFLSSTTINNPMANAVTATTTYTVTATSGTCSSTGTVTITAGSPLTATGSASPGTSVCENSSVTLNANPVGGGAPYTYSWTGPNSFTSSVQNPVIASATALATGTYTAVITDNCAASFTITVTLTVNPLPVVSVTPISGVICMPGGSPISLTASGASTYAWSPATGLSATTGTTVSANPTVGTSYTITGTDGNGCINTATTSISVSAAVTVDSITATPSSICSGGSSVLNAYGSIASAGAYCQPTYTNGTAFGDYISQVTLGTINNPTVGSASPYYTLYPTSGSTTTTLVAGNTYTITLSAGTYTQNDLAAFIDYDKNGVLNNAGEKLGETDDIGAAPATTSFTFTVPLTAYNGTTRLRVREMDHGGTNDIDPCTAQSTFGEVEDYNITITGGVNAISTVTWSPATFLSSTTGTPVNAIAVTSTTTYTATLTSSGGCVGTGTVTLTAGSPLTATAAAAPATTICAGTNVTLSATTAGGGSPFTYSWTGPNSFTSASQNPALSSITTAASGTYTCVITDNCASTFTVNVTLTVNPAPAVSVTPTSATFCSLGSPVALTASGTATTYAWLPAVGLSATTGASVNASPAVTTTYTVTGTDGVGCTSTATTTIAYSESPSISSVSVTPSTICAGSNSQLNSSVGTTAAYTLNPATFAVQPCQVTAGPTGDDNVVNAPIGFTFTYYGVSYTSLGISTNGNVQLGDGSGSANNPTYNASWTDVAIPNAATPNNMIDLAWDDWFIAAGQITYGVTGSAPNRQMIICYNTTGRGSGSADTLNGQIVLNETSNSIMLNIVKKGIQPANTSTQGMENLTGTVGSISVPNRNNQAWSANNNSVLITPSGGPITYAWSPATFLSSTTISNPAITAATATTTYTLTATSAGCSSTGTATLTVNSLPIVSLSGANQFCAGDSTLLTGSGGGTSQWYLNGVAIVGATTNTLYATVAGVYNMTKTNLNGCTDSSAVGITVIINALPTVVANATATSVCSGTNVTFTGSGASSYVWNNGVSDAVPFAVTSSGYYTVIGTDGVGCANMDSVMVTANPLPVVALGADITQCGGSVILDAANAGSTYLWSDASTNQTLSATTTGTYSVTVTDGNGCSSSDAIDVTINALPIVALGNDTTTCAGVLVLDAGNIGSTYLWSDNSTAQTLNVSATNTYSVTVTDANGCSSSDAIDITVNSVPVVSLGADVTQCGGTDTLDAMNVGDIYLWNDNSTNQTLVVATSGIYWVDVTNASGCTTRDSVTITINAIPVVSLGVDTSSCGALTLDAGNVGSTYLWNDNSINQTLSANASGTYYVDVTNASGCLGSDTISVTVNTPPTVTFTITQTTICIDDAALVLVGSPTGGTFAGANVAGNVFSPLTAALGMNYITYNYTDANGCSASVTDSVSVSACTGVVDNANPENVIIYPNPNNGQFTIQLEYVPTSAVVIDITDALGQNVQSFTMTNSTKQVDLGLLASGVYMVRVTNGDSVHVYRVVSNR